MTSWNQLSSPSRSVDPGVSTVKGHRGLAQGQLPDSASTKTIHGPPLRPPGAAGSKSPLHEACGGLCLTQFLAVAGLMVLSL